MKPVALIIDDEVQIRRLIRVALEAQNYQVHEAENGQHGLIEIANRKPAIILVDLTARVLTRAGHEIKLSATEYALLRLFVRHPGRVLTHRYILREIWGPKSEEHRQYLRVYVTHLRQKIEADSANPRLIKTEPGIGYRFCGPD